MSPSRAPSSAALAAVGAVALTVALVWLSDTARALAVVAASVVLAAGLVRAALVLASRTTVAPPPPAAAGHGVARHLDELERRVQGQVPEVVQARVAHVAVTVRDLLPRLEALGPSSPQVHTVVRCATTYVPDALGAYLRLPRHFADHRPVDGPRTALAVLCDQLDLVAAQLDQLLDAAYRKDVADLAAHGRFLDDKFATGPLTTDPVPTDPPATGPVPGATA